MPTNHLIITPLIFLLDYIFGEPVRWHPMKYFRQWAEQIEGLLNTAQEPFESYVQGFVAWVALIVPVLLISWFLSASLGWPLDVLLVVLVVSSKSLFDFVKQVPKLITEKDWTGVHKVMSQLGYQGAEVKDKKQLQRLSIEQFFLGVNSFVIGPIFWFWIGGIPMMIVYRLTRQLDIMWGDRSETHECFGKFVARLDDILNFIPSRLTALSWLLVGDREVAAKAWRAHQLKTVRSINSGLILTVSGASMNLKLGHDQAILGGDYEPKNKDFEQSYNLFKKIIWIWSIVGFMVGILL